MSTSRANLFEVVTFATDLHRGNPAFVLSDAGNASDVDLVDVCRLLGADVLAVIGDEANGATGLRFFTKTGEHPGAGHATLAAAHVAMRALPLRRHETGREALTFRLANGETRTARETEGRIRLDFPIMPQTPVDRLDEMTRALGARPSECFVAPFGYVAIFDDPETIAALEPDTVRVATFDRLSLIVTARATTGSDIVIRVFAPNAGLPEDPVCGTAHRIIIPYWAERLGQTKLHSRHLSPRGGDLWCDIEGESVVIAGESSLAVEGTVVLPRR